MAHAVRQPLPLSPNKRAEGIISVRRIHPLSKSKQFGSTLPAFRHYPSSA